MNGLKVTRKGNTIFVALPPQAWRLIDGGCACNYCKSHPEKVPMWDTLAIATKHNIHSPDVTWTVHAPEYH